MHRRNHSFNMNAALGVIAVLILGFSSSSFAVEKLKIKLSWSPTAYQSPIHLANEKGWFRDQGLDVEVEDGRGSVVTIGVVGAGSADLGSASVSAMAIARDKRELQAKAIMTIMRQSDIAVSVTKASGIKTIKDLEGRKVLYSANGFEVPFLDMFFNAGGADRKKVKLISATGSKYGAYMAGEAVGVFWILSSNVNDCRHEKTIDRDQVFRPWACDSGYWHYREGRHHQGQAGPIEAVREGTQLQLRVYVKRT